MNKKLLKIGIVLIILLASSIQVSPAYAQEAENDCSDQFQTFISATIAYDGFTEYWKDIFVRYNKNICHYQDIANVGKQLDSVRDQIKASFVKCDTATGLRLETTYYELEAELFYLRNFIDIPNSDIQELPDEKAAELLRQNFVLNKSWFTDEKIKELFNKFKTKYKSRVASVYAKCEDPGFGALKKKWDSFVKNIKSLGDQGKSIKDAWNKATSTPPQGTLGIVKGAEQFRFNNLPVKKSPDKVVKDMTTANQKAGLGTPSLTDAQQQINKSAVDHQTLVDATAIKAEYEALYKKGGDQIGAGYEVKIQQIIDKVKETYEPFAKLKKCAAKSAERQCQ